MREPWFSAPQLYKRTWTSNLHSPAPSHNGSTGYLGCRRAGSRPRLPSPCSRTCSSQSSPPSRRTGSEARTRRARSCTSALLGAVTSSARRESPPASLRPRRGSELRLGRAERTGRTCGDAGGGGVTALRRLEALDRATSIALLTTPRVAVPNRSPVPSWPKLDPGMRL